MTKSQLYDSLLRVQSDVDSMQTSGFLSPDDFVTVSHAEDSPPPEMSLYDGAFVEPSDPGPSMFSVHYDNKEGEYRLYVPSGSVWYDGEDISPKGYDGDGKAVPVSLGETLYCYVYMKKKEKSGEEEEDTWEIQEAKVGGESDKPKGSDFRLLAAVPIAKLPSASFDADPESGDDDFRQYHIGALCFTAGGGASPSSGVSDYVDVVTSVAYSVYTHMLTFKTRRMTFDGGLLTELGDETDEQEITTAVAHSDTYHCE